MCTIFTLPMVLARERLGSFLLPDLDPPCCSGRLSGPLLISSMVFLTLIDDLQVLLSSVDGLTDLVGLFLGDVRGHVLLTVLLTS